MKPGDLAEQAGSTAAFGAVNAMANAPTQGQRVGILQDALQDLCDTPQERDRAIGGFALVLTAVLDGDLLRERGHE